ncbi:matrix metalloproteinase-21-like isoform X2 [Protopterus annectens]|nr:matrix metalloproteinase-21-like isoform X2 [Protopterus annectens]
MALEYFQEFIGLPTTGIFDDATKEAMNKPRCGVPDYVSDGWVENSNLPNTDAKAITQEFNATENSVSGNHSLVSNSSDVYVSTMKSARVRKKHLLQVLVEHSRKKRSSLNKDGLATQGFQKQILKWRLIGEGYSVQLPIDKQRETLKTAFRMWSEVVPLLFEEDLSSPANKIDIKLGFGTRRHLGCSQIFNGIGQQYAHAWFLGDVHFNDDEHFVTPNHEQGISLLNVALHEIGHVLGLTHSSRKTSIMQPNYITQNTRVQLDMLDRKALQQIYGVCEGTFDVVFDWVRKENGTNMAYYNTYFFRKSWHWMYDNQHNQTRYGDPILIEHKWHGIPTSDIDAFVHIWTSDKDYTLFFKGTQYWRYDNERDEAFAMDHEEKKYPRLIKEEFPGIFSPLDTAFFDRRDNNIYFFKGSEVIAFNVDQHAIVKGYPMQIVDAFPAVTSGDHPHNNLNSVYYSYAYKRIFFMKGKLFWKVVDDNERRKYNSELPYNGLQIGGYVKDQWTDICDVHSSMLSITTL